MTYEEMMRRLPRSVRNNNPGNLEASAWARKQPGYVGTDGRFAIFETPDAGYAAMESLLQSYSNRGLNTVNSIINRWSPQSDPTNQPGSTSNYVKAVSRAVGVSPTTEIDINDPNIRNRLVRAMAEVEGGGKIPPMSGQSVTPQSSLTGVQVSSTPMTYNGTQTAPVGVQLASAVTDPITSWGGWLGQSLGGGLMGDGGSKVPFDAARPYSPAFQEPMQPMGAQFAGQMPVGGVGPSSVPGAASMALTSRPLPQPDTGWSMDKGTAKDIAGLASAGAALMAAGAPRQTWTPQAPAPVNRGRWRDDLFAGLLGL
jgi:hypothetical protein